MPPLMPLTFGALLKGERFHLVYGDGTVGTVIYTKVAAGVCKDADGQWHNIKSTQVVEPVEEKP